MTTGVIRTKGTRLYFATPLDASSSDSDGVTIKYVACATGIAGLGGPADQIDTTCLGSTEREFVQGMANPGQITVPFNAIPASGSQQALWDLFADGRNVSFMIVCSDAVDAGNVPVSVDSDDRLISAGSTTAEFLAYVSDMAIDIQTNEIVRGTLTLQRSGAVAWDWPTATLT